MKKYLPYEKPFAGARDASPKLVKHPTRRSCVRQSIDGGRRAEMIDDGSAKDHMDFWQRARSHEAGQRYAFRSNLVPRLNIKAVDASLIIRLEDWAALSLWGKTFALHLFNQGCAVDLEQLRRLARNPIGLSKRTDD